MEKLRRLKNKKGFTLVELIVVIVIIAILAAVAVPMMMKYVGDANNSAKKAQVDVVATAANAAAAAVVGGIGEATFIEELKVLLGTEKYLYSTPTPNASTITLTLKDTNKTIDITGSNLGGKNPVITKVEAKLNW